MTLGLSPRPEVCVEQGINYDRFGPPLPRSEPSSYTLVLAAQRGDRAAFLELVQGFEGIVLRVALNITHDEDAAQEIYCAVFTDAFGSVNKLDSRSSIFIWLFRILVRRSLEYCRRNPQRIENARSAGDSRLWLRDALRVLTPTDRVIFQLKQCQGLKISTLAEICELPPESIIKALRRVDRKLREQSNRPGSSAEYGGPTLRPHP